MRPAVFFFFFSVVALVGLLPLCANAVNVTLGWYPSASPDVAGYNIRYGLVSGNYTYKVPAGTNTSARVTGLVEGMTYYFVVTVYNSAGIESDPSNEIGYTVPGVAVPGTPWIQIDPATGLPVLKWSASPSPDVAGYNVYFGNNSASGSQLVFSGNATEVALSSLAQMTNGYFVVTAFDYYGQESTNSTEISSAAAQPNVSGVVPAPVLLLKRTPASGLPNVFSITASGAIPQSWALEASADLKTWGTITTGSNAAVDVNVVVSSLSKLFFRLDSSSPDMQIQAQKPAGAFPNSFFLSVTGATPATWTVLASEDLKKWNNLASGSGVDVNVAVVPSQSSGLFFRLKSR